MPPALHPRSATTLSLFTTTLAISFLVVGLPHLVPCPVQPQAYADDGTPLPRRRRRRKLEEGVDDKANESDTVNALRREDMGRARECPVPKPGGLVGQILGIHQSERVETPVVRVEKFDPRVRRIRTEQEDGKG